MSKLRNVCFEARSQKWKEATISFVKSGCLAVRLSFRMQQFGPQQKGFSLHLISEGF